MPKLYISPGLSERVHLALTRRLESFMAGASGSAMPAEMGTIEIPTVPGAPDATVAEENEHQDRDDHGNSPASENKENEERDRSRSPRGLNVPEPNPDNPLEVLSACVSLAVGVTSMVAALKTSSEKLEVLIGNTQSLQNDLVRSMDTLAKAIQGMGHAVESMAGGVSYNTGRVGALCGEFQKVRKHLEWSLDRSLGDLAKEASKKRAEDATQMTALLQQLFEAMDRFQENIKEVFHRMESLKIPASVPEKESEFGPAMPPTGHVTPMTPAASVGMPSGIIPPPVAHTMAPAVAPPQPPQPPLAVATFAGYSPAKVGEPPMTYPANLDVQFMKSPPFRVLLDESTGSVRNVSPTRQHNPATGTAAFSPLGYVVLKNTNDFRRVYP